MHYEQTETFSKFCLIPILLQILAVTTGTLGRLTMGPKSNFVLEGSTAEFTCCSDIQSLFFWKVAPTGSQSTVDIYDISGLLNGFRRYGRFNVTDGSGPGCYTLTIRDIERKDAGTYTCIDNEGLGQKLSWELVILKSFDCEGINREAGYMGENNFGLPQDIISVVCIPKYFGNIPPRPTCEWSSGVQLFDSHRLIEINTTTAWNLSIIARKEFNEAQISCHVKIVGESSENQTQTVWKSSRVKVNYAVFQQRTVTKCGFEEMLLDCDPPCDYQEQQFRNGSTYCEIAYPSHTAKKAYVLLNNTNLPQAAHTSSTINLPVACQASEAQSAGILPIVTAVLVIALICFALAGATYAAIIKVKSKRKKRQLGETDMLDIMIRKRKYRSVDKISSGMLDKRQGPESEKKTLVSNDNREEPQMEKSDLPETNAPAPQPTGEELQTGKSDLPQTNAPAPKPTGGVLQRRESDMLDKYVLLTRNDDPNDNEGRRMISRPGIVINMSDDNDLTVSAWYSDQRSSVNVHQEIIPLRAHSAMELSRTTPTPHSEPESLSIRGVAVLGEHFFCAFRQSSKVKVYSANTLGYKTSWETEEITDLQDLTACSKHDCLYISNIRLTDNECEILKLSSQGKLITKWKTERNYFGRLSVTHDFNVLLAGHYVGRLVEYGPDGTRLKDIQLSNNSFRPIHALKDNSSYFVSHGFGADPVHGVSLVGANGKVLKTFGKTRGSTVEQLHAPVHLAMNDGSILVADSRNGRVIVLSPTLEYQATLLSNEEDGLNHPLRICIDHDNRRLLLSDFQNQNHFLRAFNFIMNSLLCEAKISI